MTTEPKWKTRQAFVDHIVHTCLAHGVRNRWAIVGQINHELRLERLFGDTAPCLATWEPTDKALKEAVSRPTSRADTNGHRDIWCVPGEYRYVSIQRVRQLTRKLDGGTESKAEVEELKASVADLAQVKAHWLDKIAKARACVNQLQAAEEFATIREMV